MVVVDLGSKVRQDNPASSMGCQARNHNLPLNFLLNNKVNKVTIRLRDQVLLWWALAQVRLWAGWLLYLYFLLTEKGKIVTGWLPARTQ